MNRHIISSDRKRCSWVTKDQIYIDYHDNEWGRKLTGQRNLFEKISLEGFQAGLSWLTILKKREEFRRAFENFELNKVAAFDEAKIGSLMQNAGIIRHRGKIQAAISNAQVILNQDIDLTNLFWSYEIKARVPGIDASKATASIESDALSKELKRLGFKFVGSTTMYALMQSTGIVKSHSPNCFLAA